MRKICVRLACGGWDGKVEVENKKSCGFGSAMTKGVRSLSGKKYKDGCTGCEISKGGCGVKDRGGVIPLPGGWIVNHYDVENGFLGYLALQTKKHREHFGELSEAEAKALGENMGKVEKALREYWSENFPNDPIEHVYMISFCESLEHLHFHVFPRPKSFRELALCTKACTQYSEIEGQGGGAYAWNIYLANKCKDFPSRYITSGGQNRQDVLKLMKYLRRGLGG